MAEVLPLEEAAIARAVALLRQGGLVAFPTDTLYGIGAHAFIDEAVERVYRVKGRLPSQPLPLLVAEVTDLERYADPLPGVARRLVERFLPGGLTLVLEKAPGLSTRAAAGLNTIALRVPAHPVPRRLARELGAPLTGTSANHSGRPAAITAQEVAAQIGTELDLILDGGPCPGGMESTIIDLTGPRPRLLRKGMVKREEIQACLGGEELLW